MKIVLYILVLFAFPFSISAQYEFTHEKEMACTAVKSQGKTGTCWSFSTISFLESELIRQGGKKVDLSEMYIVRNIYLDKAQNYLLRQGKANFSQGSLSHDVMRALEMKGAVTEASYTGKRIKNTYNHSQLEKELKSLLDNAIKDKTVRANWRKKANELLDQHMGALPSNFTAKKAMNYVEQLSINPNDYVTLTSYTHHPFYETFVLEIPDNYSNGSYYNLPIDELQTIANHALENGFTITWDGDVSEKGFNARQGIAVLPQDQDRADLFTTPGKELEVDQALRQSTFESYATTDDHLMHITGLAKDQNDNTYYLTKNSWGELSLYKGFLYISDAYFRLKTVSIMVHKDAIPETIADKLNL
ncbi:MAG: C1 family peptidase [Bacteroidota bacterium]